MFHSARITLTAWYLLIIMVISGTFSGIIYNTLLREVQRFGENQRYRIERRLIEREILENLGAPKDLFPPTDEELVEETRKRIIYALLIINGSILVISGGLGYVLAGQTLQPIKEMMDEQNRFVSDASHELKTPLTSLKAAFEVYLRDPKRTRKDADNLVDESISEVNKLQKLSESLLELAHFQNSSDTTVVEKISAKEVVEVSIKKVAPLAVKKQIKLSDVTTKSYILANQDKLINVLVILLDNAIKFSPKNSTVNISSKIKRGRYYVNISDKGIGISPQDLPHIFDRFYRADSARLKTGADGYGLGLSIARKTIESMNGSITVETKENEGSAFTISLPVTSKKALRI